MGYVVVLANGPWTDEQAINVLIITNIIIIPIYNNIHVAVYKSCYYVRNLNRGFEY